MKKNKVLALLTVSAMMLGLLAACGGGSTATPAPQESNAPVESTAPVGGGESEYNGPKVVIKIAQGGSSTGHSGVALINFEERVEARTGGLVDVQCYADAQLGTELEIAQGVALGTIEMALPGVGTFANFYDKLMFCNMPFLLDNREQSYAFYDGEFMQNLNDEVLAATGMRVLGWGENGARGLSNSVREIKTPEDLKGLKIRVQENPVHIAMINALGGSATPISFPELYTSLSQKTVDGQDNGIPLTVNNAFYEVQKYYTTTDHNIDQLVFITNDSWFNSLDATLQNILLEEVENWKWDIRQLSIDFENSGIDTMEDAGLTVTRLSDEDKQPFKALMGDAEKVVRDLVGSDFYDEVLVAVEEAKAEAEAHPSDIVH